MNTTTSSSAVSQQRRRKRMRTQTRSTPWKDSFELDSVGRALLLAGRMLSSDGSMTPTLLSKEEQADLQHVLYRVNMWKARSDQGRIPHSMETTFTLAQVAWRDAISSGQVSSMELRMAYATAILRGVNGLADALQQNRAYAASVASLCEQIGLPGWLVDIRHEAAHNDLPTLSVLRLATKTFLGYLEERYWTPMANSRFEMRDAAADLLVKYKETCKKTPSTSDGASEQKPVDETSSSESSFSSEEEESEPSSNNLGTNRNRFAVFLDTAGPVKSKKQRQMDEVKAKEKAARVASKEAVHSALHFARAFVRDVPIDVGYQVALSFLVWGGIGEAPSGRGVLIPGSPASFPETEEGIQRIRQRYKPLILVLCKAWPGFADALLVHMIDHVLSIEASIIDEVDAGSERKLYFLTSWIRFLLSREFHVRNDKSIAQYKRQDLSDKRPAKWTKAEREFMESPAPYPALSQAQLPLNSLCDRCLTVGKPGVASGGHTLGMILTDVLGEDRVENYGVSVNGTDTLLGPRKPEPVQAAVEARHPIELSLNHMERLLDDNTTQKEATLAPKRGEPLAPSTDVKSAWSQCQTWEACAIGSLPGRV